MSCRIHSVVWFQLAKVRVTSFSEQFVPIAGRRIVIQPIDCGMFGEG